MGVRAPEPSRLRQDPIRYSACNDHHPIQTGGSRRLDHAPTSLCRTLPCASTSDRDQGLFDSSLRPHPSSSPHFWRFFLFLFTAFRVSVRMTSKKRTQCGATRTGDAIASDTAWFWRVSLHSTRPYKTRFSTCCYDSGRPTCEDWVGVQNDKW